MGRPKGAKNGEWSHGRYGYDTGCRCDICMEAVRAQSRKRRRGHVDWVATLKTGPCMDCGGLFPPECMDFDHRPGEEKSFVISATTRSKAAVLAEMQKCDLVCSNCHRIRTRARSRRV